MRDNTTENITIKDIYNSTDNGLDIFKNEIKDFKIGKNICNPFKTDRNPSCRIKQSKTSGLWLLYIYNEGNKYLTAIEFLKQKYGFMSFGEVVNYIQNNHNLQQVNYQEVIKPIVSSDIIYDTNIIPFGTKHNDYFNPGGLYEDYLNSKDIYAIDKFAINKTKVIDIPKNEIAFVYKHRNINGNLTGKVKILRIGKNVDKQDKWKTNLHNSAIWYTNTITEDCKYVFIAKSNKDALVNQLCRLCTVATQSENSFILSQNIIKLKELFPLKEFVILFGSDEQGTEESIKVTKEHNLQWFNIPKQYLNNGVNDPFSFVAKFGLERYKELLKNKDYL